MRKILVFLLNVAPGVVAPLVSFAHASIPKQIVPCGSGGNPCELCDIFSLAHNIFDFLLWGFALPVAGLIFLYGGIMVLTAGDSPGRRQTGLSAIKSAFWGILIAFSSWLIVNTVINSLGAGALSGAWSTYSAANCPFK